MGRCQWSTQREKNTFAQCGDKKDLHLKWRPSFIITSSKRKKKSADKPPRKVKRRWKETTSCAKRRRRRTHSPSAVIILCKQRDGKHAYRHKRLNMLRWGGGGGGGGGRQMETYKNQTFAPTHLKTYLASSPASGGEMVPVWLSLLNLFTFEVTGVSDKIRREVKKSDEEVKDNSLSGTGEGLKLTNQRKTLHEWEAVGSFCFANGAITMKPYFPSRISSHM